MTEIDALAYESQFLDHLAPVWRALGQPGRLLVDPSLEARAVGLGLTPTPTPRPAPVPSMPSPNRDGRPALVASYGDVKVGRRLGFGPFVFLEHGAGQSYNGERGIINGSYAGGFDREDNELLLVPNDTCAGEWRRSYPRARVEVIGCPRLDDLPRREVGPGPVVALSFHWPATGVSPEANTALGDYMTELGRVAERFATIGHGHPKGDWPARLARIYSRYGIAYEPSFEAVCRRADVYVCDNSSTLFEFATTGRPVVVLNSRNYRRRVNHGLRFWDAAGVGIQVDEAKDLIPAIERALEDPPEVQRERERALDIVYAYRSGAAERGAQCIGAWLSARANVAA